MSNDLVKRVLDRVVSQVERVSFQSADYDPSDVWAESDPKGEWIRVSDLEDLVARLHKEYAQ